MRRMSDTKLSEEVKAMATIESVLSHLDEETQRRVLRWAGERYKTPIGGSGRARTSPDSDNGGGATGGVASNPSSGPANQYSTFAEFFAAASPTTDADRVLVAAYWSTLVQGETDLDARSLNSQLRDLGYAVNHMPSAFDTLIARKPNPVVQTRKTGKSKQATRRIKLTGEGRRAVERMLTGG